MKLKSLIVGAATALTMVSPAIADLTFPNLTYRTGPYAVNGIPYACLLYTSDAADEE